MKQKTRCNIPPIEEIPPTFCKNLKLLFTDIDGTITKNGQITDASYSALWDLSRAGIDVVPVTGRPAGWCDHIARMWPVKGIIGENGAFFYLYDRKNRKMLRNYLISEEEKIKGKKILEKIKTRVLREVPGAGIAADQPFRVADLAIDYCEDVEHLKKEDIQKICRIITEEGGTYKISDIHINCWYGSFNKITGVKKFIAEVYQTDFSQIIRKATYIGDSPNDEPIFRVFPTTIAVANLKDFIDEISHLPNYITHKESAYGFREAVDTILKKRKER
ncbi:MAG: HAD family hydrolase [Spirochaetes bacterium]|nr:MAG: HAD family hydrolase [Spirochaetota bacterium]